ncbi:PCI-domain-containing protein [Basidiobolus meristosporus CBS 931.73]|uniref:Eukaryotic translation initiation factor 3 subunit M n=1 Tax=Basidiobolus meristosporus CBS 931.73 TaxID=1314790 RepID=A0A1Y1XYV5_9FUNG|nr:PCI-domain-containing protein [Basidiobolus meristosporus CBS 931.73]|eukprot:ORX90835.1 PCI-domain-containing protein [Basidiobolus meristosporus CBS 931.73]
MENVNTIFVEGSPDVQALDFASYVSDIKGEENENSPYYLEIKALVDSEKFDEVYQKFVDESDLLLTLDDQETELAFNHLLAVIVGSKAASSEALLQKLIEALVKAEGKASVRMQILSNYFNVLPATFPLRYTLFVAVVNVASQNNRMEAVASQLKSVDSWLQQWGASKSQIRELYLLLSEKLNTAQYYKQSYEYALKYLASFDSDAEEAKPFAKKAIVDAIKMPGVFQFEDLSKMPSVQLLQGETIFKLMNIFLNGSLTEYNQFVAENGQAVQEFGFNEEDNINKIRMLTLASLGSEHLGNELSYSAVCDALKIDADEVEFWVIDVVRAGLIEAKLNQLNETVTISRSTRRVFTTKDWEELGAKMKGWKQSLSDILKVVSNAKVIAQSSVNANGNATVSITTNAATNANA